MLISAGKSFPLHPEKLNLLSPLNEYIRTAERFSSQLMTRKPVRLFEDQRNK